MMVTSGPTIEHEVLTHPLPARLSALADDVVRRTRLWPREKIDVRAELESHFKEGLIDLLERGQTFEQSIDILADQFGDARLAARLIQRGKKRGRPMAWRVTLRVVMVLIMVLGATVAYAGWIMLGQPNPTVDYVAQLNEPIQTVPEDQRAWPLLRDILLELQPIPEEYRSATCQLPRPGGVNWDLAREWVHSNRHLLDRITQAVQRPTYGFLYGNEHNWDFMRAQALLAQQDDSHFVDDYLPDPLQPPLLTMHLPSLSDTRDLARFLILHSRDRFQAGEAAAAWQSLDDAHRLGVLLLDGRTLIEALVAAHILRMTNDEIRRVWCVQHLVLTEEQWQVVWGSSWMSLPPENINAFFDGETMMFKDILQYVFTDDGQGNGHLIPEQLGRIISMNVVGATADADERNEFAREAQLLAAATVHADRRATWEKYRTLWDQAAYYRNLPLYDPARPQGTEMLEAFIFDPVMSQRYALIRYLMPALDRPDEILRATRMSQDATQTVTALMRFRQEHRRWPETLAALVPDYQSDVPVDVYSGAPLAYRLDDRFGFVLYSVGENFVDDGGVDAESNGTETQDLVFWPAL